MYTNETHRFETEQEMLDYLKDFEPVGDNKKIAIIGGHYMLMYDKYNDELIPMIHQDIKDPEQKEFAKLWAGDFPVKTFEYAVELYKHYNYNKGYDSKIALIVNDHKFQSKHFKEFTSKEKQHDNNQLRKHYYRKENIIPVSYCKSLLNHNFPHNEIFLDNSKKRSKQDILPKSSLFFSEQNLINDFNNKQTKELIKNENFYNINENGYSNLYFFKEKKELSICLTKNGIYDCSAEIIQFMYSLLKNQLNNIIFLSPSECFSSVNSGIDIVLYLLRDQKSLFCNIININGLGGIGGDNQIINSNGIKINQYYHTI